MKKVIKLISILSLVGLLSACSTVIADNSIDYSNQTLVGQISEINGNTVTLTLGKLKESEQEFSMQEGEMPEMNGEFDGQMPEMQDGEMPELPEDFDGTNTPQMNGERSELPEDFDESELPQMNGGMHQGGRRMGNGQMPGNMSEGGMPEMPEGFDESQIPEGVEDGQFPDMSEMSGDMKMGGKGQFNITYTFKANSKTAEITLNEVTVTLSDNTTGSISDLKVGDVVEIIVGDNNTITSITVYNISEE